ncbi:MAG: hypothetical protein JXA04_10840 [Gammaproteobacteria bacterium]|nr:hypothetical protein [Gammaproteobacteria bacterium]
MNNIIYFALLGIIAFILLERLMSFYIDFVEWFFVKAWQIRTKYKMGYYKDKPIRKAIAAVIALCFVLVDIYFRMTWICVRFNVKPKFEMTTTFLKRMKKLPACAPDNPDYYRKALATYICAARIEPTDPGHCD